MSPAHHEPTVAADTRGIRVKHGLHLGLQNQVRDRLSNPVSDSGARLTATANSTIGVIAMREERWSAGG
jgi:hypothetical protein